MKYADAVREIAKGKLAWRPEWPTDYFIKMMKSRRIHDSEERFFPQPKHRADVKATDWIAGETRVAPVVHRPVVKIPPPPPPQPTPPPPPVQVVVPVVAPVATKVEEKPTEVKKETLTPKKETTEKE